MAVEIEKLLDVMIEKSGSDLHLTVDRPPTIRLNGQLRSLNIPILTADDTMNYVKAIATKEALAEFEKSGSSDFAVAYKDKARYRVSVFRQKGNAGMVLRQIPSKLLSFEEIGLSQDVKKLLDRPRGLILVTGPTGSGKTTTLATMIDDINQNRSAHIITIEDPIEYYHTHKNSIITQREIGRDIKTFAEAIRRALRMDPDVILVGEMRDLETIQTAITAAETGHLVLGTLHTTGAAKTVNRIIDVFPLEQQEQIRTQLASSIIAVISQVLVPKKDKSGIVAAFEVMITNSAVENLIRENQPHKIISVLQTGGKQGMILLDDSLYSLYKSKIIEFDDMMKYAQIPKYIEDKIKDGVRQKK